MKKRRSYYLTDTGIRISRYIVKRMPPPQADCSENLFLAPRHTNKPTLNLYLINNLHLHTESLPSLENDQAIEAEYKEVNDNDV